MPLFGQLDLPAVLPALPDMPDLDTTAWELPGAQFLYLALEVEAGWWMRSCPGPCIQPCRAT